MSEARTRQPNLVAIQIVDKDGNPIADLSEKNVKILAVTKKISVELYNQLKETPGSFIVRI